tara:strand:+ start:310 stop:654 length:345 start_codon:yes stop_codon:yes gene_type:complete
MKKSNRIPKDDQFSEGDIRRTLTNIFHVSCGTIPPFLWVAAIERFIDEEGIEKTAREAVRSFNEGVESIGQFDEALDEDAYAQRFMAQSSNSSGELAEALLNDLLPRAKKWSGT